MEMLFTFFLFPKLRPLCVAYVMWMWWATMYLTHHYLIDLVGGSIYALITFAIYWRTLPTPKPGARTRLDYFDLRISLGAFLRTIEMDVPQDWKKQHDSQDFYNVAVDIPHDEDDTMKLKEENMQLRLERLNIVCHNIDLASGPGSLTSSSTPQSLSESSSPCSTTFIEFPTVYDKNLD